MLPEKKEHPSEKSRLHPRSKHRARYDFKKLIASCTELAPFVKKNVYGDESVDFADPKAVMMLNKALLKHHYNIDQWNIPENYLCPPIPGRADYLHHISDLLASINSEKIPTGKRINCLDIGVGANCIYPLIGHKEYGWSFVGADIDKIALDAAEETLKNNPEMKGVVDLRLQPNESDIFKGIIKKEERFDLTISNPPFHSSAEEAQAISFRKTNNLTHKKSSKASKPQKEIIMGKPVLNFGGQSHELWCEGGEKQFISNMIDQSKQYAKSCFWFSTLVSKQNHLKDIERWLFNAEATKVKILPMGQGNKSSRIVAWTFLTRKEQEEWKTTRW
jgi:23S rRNA (adenine1618-N6)-methyltransferase